MRSPRSRVLVAAVAIFALMPAVGHAVPDDLVADLDDAEAELADLDARVSLAVEEYNIAASQLARVEAQHTATTERVGTLTAEAERLEARTAAYVRSMYMRGPTTDLTVAFQTTEVAQAGRDLAMMTRLTRQRHAELEQLGATRAALDEAQTQLAEQVRAAAAREQELDDRRAEVEALLSGQRDEVLALRGRVAEVQAEEAARAEAERLAAEQARAAATASERAASEQAASEREASEAAAEAAAAAASQAAAQASPETEDAPEPAAPSPAPPEPSPSSPPPPEPQPPPPGTRAGADRAVDAALSQVGKPYEYAASGPDSYDCSGLTLWAWRHAGVELPHSSRMQYAATTRISRDQLQAGDLIFYGSPIHHVAMYLDGTRVVEAPYTGANVRIREDGLLRSDIAGYGRP